MEIAIVAGEASGDRMGAALLAELGNELGSDRPFSAWGIGGVLLARAGVELLADSRDWGAIGIAEVLRKIPGMFPAMRAMKRRLSKRPPAALILVDFGAFNVRLAKWVKRHSICPVFYFMPPGSWRRHPNPKRLATFAKLADLIVTPFPWSEQHLREAGANVKFLGHPLLDLVKTVMEPNDFDARYGLDASRMVITLLPGSREHEVKNILPIFLAAAGEIASRVPGAQFLLGLSPNLTVDSVAQILRAEQDKGNSAKLLALMHEAGGRLRRAASAMSLPPVPSAKLATAEGFALDPADVAAAERTKREPMARNNAPITAPLAVVEGMTYDAIARADLVLTCSGTATLEAAILNRPMIIAYTGGQLMMLEWAIRKKTLSIDFIGLPNILAGSKICPEFLAENVTARALADTAVEMLLQPERLIKIKSSLNGVVKTQLGEPGGIRRAAKIFAREILQ